MRLPERPSAKVRIAERWIVSLLALICFTIGFSLAGAERCEAVEEPLAVGFAEFDAALDIIASRHPAAEFIRRAVAVPLLDLRAAGDHGATRLFRLRLSDGLEVDPIGRRWSFRMNRGAAFSNGARVLAADVEYSLGACAVREPALGALIDRIETAERGTTFEERESWISIYLKGENAPAEFQRKLVTGLAKCPIFEKRSAELFGAAFGRGTNYIALGAYAMVDFRPGREFRLERRPGVEPARHAASAIELRSFAQPSHALTALRAGTLDAFYTQDGETIARAQKDHTLEQRECNGETVIARRGLRWSCEPALDVLDIGYRS